MRYYLAENGQEYTNPEDCVKYGNGLKGYRETTNEVVKATYTELTGKEPPESPVDHVIVQQAEPPKEVIETSTGPVPVTDLSPTEPPVQTASEPIQVVVEKEILSTPLTVPEIKEELKKEEIVATNLTDNVTIVDWDSKTDEELRALCKAKKIKGAHLMGREKMIKKLS